MRGLLAVLLLAGCARAASAPASLDSVPADYYSRRPAVERGGHEWLRRKPEDGKPKQGTAPVSAEEAVDRLDAIRAEIEQLGQRVKP